MGLFNIAKTKERVIFEATIPRLQIVYFTKVAQMLSSLYWLKYPVTFEILLVKGVTLFYFTAHPEDAYGFANALYAHIDWIDLEEKTSFNIDKERGLNYSEEDTKSDYLDFFEDYKTVIQYFKPLKGITEPFNNDLSYQSGDPLSTILAPYSGLEEGEKVLFQIVIFPIKTRNWENVVKNRARDILYNAGMYSTTEKIIKTTFEGIKSLMTGGATQSDYMGVMPVSQEQILPIEQQAIQEISLKIISQPFLTEIKLFVDSPRADELIKKGAGAIRATFMNLNTLISAKKEFKKPNQNYRVFRNFPYWMFNTELARVFRPPTFFTAIEGIKWSQAKELPIPPNISTSPPFIGIATHRKETKVVGLDPIARSHHIFVDGKTGTGKSTFLVNFILQMIYKNEESLMFIDPHGDAVQNILKAYPEERIDDLIYIDFSTELNPVSINILMPSMSFADPTVHVSNLIEIFQMKWADSWGPRMEWILAEIMTAMVYINKTIVKAPDLLPPGLRPFTIQDLLLYLSRSQIGAELREKVYSLFNQCYVEKQIKEEVNSFIEPRAFENSILKDPEVSRSITAIQNKLSHFVLKKQLLSITGQPYSNISFEDILLGIDIKDQNFKIGSKKTYTADLSDKEKHFGKRKYVVLVNVSKGVIGASADILGSILVNMVSQAIYTRSTIQQKGMLHLLPSFSLIIDEFQNFTTPSIATMLSEVRKYNTSIVLATQFLGNIAASMSMRDDRQIKRLIEAILANCRNVLIFQIEVDDAYIISHNLGERTIFPTDLTQVPKYHAIVKPMKEREALTPVLCEMLPMLWTKERDFIRELVSCKHILNKKDFYNMYNKYKDVSLSDAEFHKNKIIGMASRKLLSVDKINWITEHDIEKRAREIINAVKDVGNDKKTVKEEIDLI